MPAAFEHTIPSHDNTELRDIRLLPQYSSKHRKAAIHGIERQRHRRLCFAFLANVLGVKSPGDRSGRRWARRGPSQGQDQFCNNRLIYVAPNYEHMRLKIRTYHFKAGSRGLFNQSPASPSR